MSDFALVICTYRRPDVLAATLRSLAAVERPDADWDLLIVDNGADRRVEEVARSWSARLPIRYEIEPQVGIARARNRAMAVVTAPIVLFADDDVLFDPRWLCAMVAAVRSQSRCAFWGGRIEPLWEVPRPRWFDIERCPTLGDSIVRYDLGDQPRPWRPGIDPEFYTCNLGLRAEAVRRAGMFDPGLGHQGERRGGGEDSWMIRTIARQGGSGWYAADALLRHPVPASRLTRCHARAFAWSQGRVGIEMLRREHADDAHPGGRTPRWLYRLALGQAVAGLGRWCAGTVRLDPGLAFAGQFGALFALSKLWHALAGARGRVERTAAPDDVAQ